jgi:membrane-associated phospholipid phosphatase
MPRLLCSRARQRLVVLLAPLVIAGSWPAPLFGQDTTQTRVPPTQIVSIGAGAALSFVPQLLAINNGPPSCAPCDPATLPGIDRWIVRPEQSGWDIASSVTELGLAAGTLYEMYRQPDGTRYVLASVESAAWTFGLTQVSKAIINRKRPVLYTEDAEEAATHVGSHRSLPSGHASFAFALATSYVLSMKNKKGVGRYWPLAAAAAISAMRVAAARHFPTDVIAGAAVGAGTAIVIHEIRF